MAEEWVFFIMKMNLLTEIVFIYTFFQNVSQFVILLFTWQLALFAKEVWSENKAEWAKHADKEQ